MQRSSVTHAQVIAIHAELKKHILPQSAVDRNGKHLVRYAEGVDDKSIAKALGISHISVERMRREMFGKLIGSVSDEENGCSAIERRISRLEDREIALRNAVELLASGLDVKVELE